MVSRQEVVITGCGAVSPLGNGKEVIWQAVQKGESGVRVIPWLTGSPDPVGIGAEVLEFDPKPYIRPRKSLKVMSREMKFGNVAAALAQEDAQLDPTSLDSDRFGVTYGVDMLYFPPMQVEQVYRACMKEDRFVYDEFGTSAMKELHPLWLLLCLPNMVACHIGISCGARGPTNTITLGEISGLLAIIEATHAIQRGQVDVMIAGGVGNLLNPTPMVHRGRDLISLCRDNPAGASRPFDADRDGLVRGQGSGALVLESRKHAEQRGATILAAIRGAGVAFERMDEPCGATSKAIARSVSLALRESQLHAGEIDGVFAHGASTVIHDQVEATAIQETLGETPVTAPSSYYGIAGAASAPLSIILGLLAQKHRQLPPTLNYHTSDPQCPIQVIHGAPHSLNASRLAILGQSTTGQAATIVIE